MSERIEENDKNENKSPAIDEPFYAELSPIRSKQNENYNFEEHQVSENKGESKKSTNDDKKAKIQRFRWIFQRKVIKKKQYNQDKTIKNKKLNSNFKEYPEIKPHIQIPVFESKINSLRPFILNRSNSTLELKNTLYIQKKKNSKKPDILESSLTEKFIYLPGIGSKDFGDVPLRIIDTLKIKDKFFFRVEWRSRKDGSMPLPSLLSTEEIKDIDPYFLLTFYESRIYSH